MKTTFLKIIFQVFFLSFIVISSNAQDKKPAVTTGAKNNFAMQTARVNSKFPVPVQNLMKFTGRWVANATLIVDGKAYQVEYHITGRSAAEGYGVYIDEFFNDSVLGRLRAANLVGYDVSDSKIHWYAVDNESSAHDHSGDWVSSDSLTIKHSGTRNGKTYTEKIDFGFRGRDEMVLNFVATLDGKETKKATGVFRREKQVPTMKAKPTAPVETK